MVKGCCLIMLATAVGSFLTAVYGRTSAGLCLELSVFPQAARGFLLDVHSGRRSASQPCRSTSAPEPFVSDSGSAPTIKSSLTY